MIDAEMIEMADCSEFKDNPSMQEFLESVTIIIDGTWVPRELVTNSRLPGYDLAMRAIPPDCRNHGL